MCFIDNKSDNVYYDNKCVWRYEFYNMSCDSNDDELKLTKEYKSLLSYIRPLIDQLDKSRDAQLCLLWLSKLEQCASWERNYRNKILSELCKQVKSNCLKPPFNVAPQNGPLRNIVSGDWKARDSITNECSEVDASTEEVFSTSSHHSFSPEKNFHKHPIFSVPWKGGYFCNNSKMKSTKLAKEVVDHSECFAIQRAYHERVQSDQMVIERYQDIIKSLVSQQLKADISPNRLKKLQSDYEVKLSNLVHSLKKAQEENEMLKRKITRLGGDVDNLHTLKNENETLRQQLFDLENEKNELETKCKQSEEEKMVSLSDLISKLNEAEKKMKESEKRCKSLEKKYEDFEAEVQSRINEKEKMHLTEMSTLENLLEEKQAEINDLKEQMNNHNSYLELEISRLKQQLEENLNMGRNKEKIKNWKNKAKKLEKVREHMTVLFQSQLQQILAKKDFYIASLEMQLKMNNSESGGSILSSDFHNSLDQKISNLETQYRKLLEDSEQQSIKRRQQDLQKIHTLEKQLLTFGGVVMDNESNGDQIKVSSITSDSSEVNPNGDIPS